MKIHTPELAAAHFRRAVHYHDTGPADALMLVQARANLARALEASGDIPQARSERRAARDLCACYPELREFDEYALLLVELASSTDIEAEQEQLLRQALAVARMLHPAEDSTLIARVAVPLAYWLVGSGSLAEAEHHLNEALGTWHRHGDGIEDPEVAEPTLVLAHLIWVRNGPVQDCARLADMALFLLDARLHDNLGVGLGTDNLQQAADSRGPLDVLVSMACDRHAHPALVRVAATTALRRHGLLTELSAQRFEPEHEQYINALANARAELSEALLAQVPDDQLCEYESHVIVAEETLGLITGLNADPADPRRRLPEPERERRFKRWLLPLDHLPAALPEDTLLIEYMRYLHCEPRFPEDMEQRYAAIAWHGASDTPEIVPLGRAAAIDELVGVIAGLLEDAGAALEQGRSADGAAWEEPAGRLRALLLDPVLAGVDAAQRLVLAVDGTLGAVPFAALPTPTGHVLDEYVVTFVECGRDLYREVDDPPADHDPPVVVADPDFDLGLSTADRATPPEQREHEAFARLPGAAAESAEVATMLGVDAVTGADACESALRALRSPPILHLATHGWYLPEDLVGWEHHPRLRGLTSDSPLTWPSRSGVVLAGFNARWSGHELPAELGDGVLTAGEATALDLRGTELVAVSACESSRGRSVPLEGAQGIRRAFTLAGARSTLTTLWKVPDAPAQHLVTSFYRELLAGERRDDALRVAQLETRRRYPQHPVAWGAFVLHGRSGPLDAQLLADLPGHDRTGRRRTSMTAALRGWLTAIGMEELDLDALDWPNLDFEEIVRVWQTAAEASPSELDLAVRDLGPEASPLARFLLARALYRRGRDETAEALLRAAARDEFRPAQQLLALLLLGRGQRETALELWRAGAEKGSGDSMHSLGLECLQDGRQDEAVAWWRRGAAAGNGGCAWAMAQFEEAHGDAEAAAEWLQRAGELNVSETYPRLGHRAYAAGDRATAFRWFAAAGNTGDTAAAHNAGVMLDEQGIPGAALWWARAARGGDDLAAYALARWFEARGDDDRAERHLRAAIARRHGPSHARLAALLLRTDRAEAAEAIARAGADADPASAGMLAVTLQQLGHPDEAAQWDEAAAARGDLRSRARIAVAALNRGDEVDPALLSEAAHQGVPEAVRALAQVKLTSDNPEEGIIWLRAAVDAGVTDVSAMLAAALLTTGQRAEAREVLARVPGRSDRALRLAVDLEEDVLVDRAERGHVLAANALRILAEIRGDLAAVLRWTAVAAERHDLAALLTASLLARAAGEVKRPRAWLTEAVEAGLPAAASALADLERAAGNQQACDRWAARATELAQAMTAAGTGRRLQQQPEEAAGALEHYRYAAEAGSRDAAANLARALLHDDPSSSEGRYWAIRAARAGDGTMASTLANLLATDGHLDSARAYRELAADLVRGR